MINISILGSTGSIGTQVLDVCKRTKDKIKIMALGAMENADLLVQQIKEFTPEIACIGNETKYEVVKQGIGSLNTKIVTGKEGFLEISAYNNIDKLIMAIAGFPGFAPTIKALETGKTVCIASKEVLVVAGHIVSKLSKEKNLPLIPIDSEHSAIFQCINGENPAEIKQIILTASGGAFRDRTKNELKKVTPKEALNHPTWKMGQKVTIDSATLMNKGLEIIEAKWLFDLNPHQISVLLHHQSIIHSMVEFNDSSIIAQLGVPDMRTPIQYSLFYPERINTNLPRLDLGKIKSLTFDEIDDKKYPCLSLAKQVLLTGGSMPCVLNAADDTAVDLFLKGKIGFLDIAKIVEKELKNHIIIKSPTVEEIIKIDEEIHERLLKDYSK